MGSPTSRLKKQQRDDDLLADPVSAAIDESSFGESESILPKILVREGIAFDP